MEEKIILSKPMTVITYDSMINHNGLVRRIDFGEKDKVGFDRMESFVFKRDLLNIIDFTNPKWDEKLVLNLRDKTDIVICLPENIETNLSPFEQSKMIDNICGIIKECNISAVLFSQSPYIFEAVSQLMNEDEYEFYIIDNSAIEKTSINSIYNGFSKAFSHIDCNTTNRAD